VSAPLRDIRLVRDGEQQRAPNLIGLDESMVTVGETRYTIIVAVRTARENEISLLRALINNDLQPFKHKSSSLLRYGGVTPEERATRVQGLIEDLQSLQVSWSAILWEGPDEAPGLAACAVTAAKKKPLLVRFSQAISRMGVVGRLSFTMVVQMPIAIILNN